MVTVEHPAGPPLYSSKEAMSLFTAAKIYGGKKAPTNKDADVHMQQLNYMPLSWVVGTRIVYEKPDVPFGSYVEAGGLAFEVPKKYRGLKDAALIMQGPDFIFDEEAPKFSIGKVTSVVKDYPQESGWYETDTIGIPQGHTAPKEMKTARYLWRIENGPHIGAIVRGYLNEQDINTGRIFASHKPEVTHNIATFVPDGLMLTGHVSRHTLNMLRSRSLPLC